MEHRAPGLTAASLNTWLAAIGITVLLEGGRLAWTGDRRPVALVVLSDGVDLATEIARTLPSLEGLNGLLIANHPKGRFPRQIGLETYAAAASEARSSPHDCSLALSVTDLASDARSGGLNHSTFDVAAPRGETLWMRLRACRAALPSDHAGLVRAVGATLDGRAERKSLNGLGFDAQRIEAGDPPQGTGGKFVDPLAEVLAFFGLWLFPVRGDGDAARTRGWRPSDRGRRSSSSTFVWPAWSSALDRWAIDALLAKIYSAPYLREASGELGIARAFELVRYRRTGDMDQTAGYASRTL